MGASQDNSKKRCILYGLPGSGKTLFLFQLSSEQRLSTKEGGESGNDTNFEFLQTLGINYEEVSLNKKKIGIFDISGEKSSYTLLNLICKNVEISGVIFVMSLKDLEKIDQVQEALEVVLGNNYLMPEPKLYIIYNNHNDESYSWLSVELLDSKLEIEKLNKKYKVKDYHSEILDVSEVRGNKIPSGLNLFAGK